MTDTVAAVTDIRPDPKQPRRYFKQSAIRALARSLQLVGQRTPIQVKRLPPGGKHRFEIIDGERRWRAHQLAGITTIRITVEEQELDDRKQHLLSTISNFHRESHTHMEISDALAYQRSLGESVQVLAENLDKSESWIYQYLKLQDLAPDLKLKMHPETDDRVRIRFAEAFVLASLSHAQQTTLYREGVKYTLGARLPLYRKRAAALQGKERTGRPVRASERLKSYDTYVQRLSQFLDVALDMTDKEFRKMLLGASTAEIRRLAERMTRVGADIGQLLQIIDSKLMFGEGEGDIPGLEQIKAVA